MFLDQETAKGAFSVFESNCQCKGLACQTPKNNVLGLMSQKLCNFSVLQIQSAIKLLILSETKMWWSGKMI